jgi:23S rRNA pseudouridine1911/1915/1917 synthase
MNVIFQDAAIVVVDKPAGQIVHPAPGHETGAMTQELVREFPEMASVGSKERPGVVHRLDVDTSGVMVFARTQAAYLDLRRQFEAHRDVRKTYLAACHWKRGVAAKGTVELPIERQVAVSHYEVLGRQGSLAMVRFDIETGRTHQIRIHAAKGLGCPLVGDSLYGDAARDRALRRRPSRTLLHAVELSFLHPVTHRRVTFSAPPPRDLVFVG